MAKTTAPLFGFGAAGSVGESITFSKWRGVSYAKRYTKPSNPNTLGQQQTRKIFSGLNDFWKLAPAALVTAWTDFAKGRSFVNRNAFIGQNIKTLRSEPPATSMVDFIASPGSGGAAPASDIDLVPGDAQITIAITLPQLPTGWSIARTHAIAFLDQSPDDPFNTQIHYVADAVTPESIDITGLTNDEPYVVSVWVEYVKPDGKPAYSVSLTDLATPTD